jgi:isopenicillin-N N-acyltransferase like protein
VFAQITIAGAPFERGQQYGAHAAKQVRHSVASYAALFAYRRGLSWAEAQAQALRFVPLLTDVVPELVEEMRGVAAGAGRAFGEIVALNARTELLAGALPGPAHPQHAAAVAQNRAAQVPEHGECTTVAALPPATNDGATLLAQTWDWTGDQRAACVVLRIRPAGGPEALTVTEGGILAKIGLNSAGVAVALNILRSHADGADVGMPVHLLLRAMLGARSFDEAVALASRAPAGASSCVTVASDAGRAVSLEVTPGSVVQLVPERGLLAHTNHCLDSATQAGETPFDPQSSTVPRYERASALLAEAHGRIDAPMLMALLRDEVGAPLCRSNAPCTWPLACRARSILCR